MKGPLEAAATREYPHLVTRAGRHLVRWDLVVSNEPIPHHAGADRRSFIGVGMLDVRHQLTPMARRCILETIGAEARKSRIPRCIVWSATDCTWLSETGQHLQGGRPPVAEVTRNPYLYESMPVATETCWTIELPAGNEPTHLCIVPIDKRRVEIAPGEPIDLALFDEPIMVGERDPVAAMLDQEGNFVPPASFRGQPVREVDGWLLLGPVQPCGTGIVLRDPWPDEIRTACEKIAGIPLPQEIIDQAWRAACPERREFNPVGVLQAA